MNAGVSETTDEEIFERVARGDRAAFAHLVARHRNRVTALAARMTGNHAMAEDIVQEAFMRAWRAAPGWIPRGQGGEASFRTWLTRIAINLAIDRLRRQPPLGLDEIAEPLDEAPGVEHVMIAREQERLLARAVAALPDRQRAAIALTYDEGLSNGDAAASLGTTVGAFELLLVRARRALRLAIAST